VEKVAVESSSFDACVSKDLPLNELRMKKKPLPESPHNASQTMAPLDGPLWTHKNERFFPSHRRLGYSPTPKKDLTPEKKHSGHVVPGRRNDRIASLPLYPGVLLSTLTQE